VPITTNDGTRVPREFFKKFEARLIELAGGFSEDGIVNGCWMDEDRTVYRDRSKRYIVATHEANLGAVKELILEIGKKLRQRAMYFEVVADSEIQFLDIE